MAQTWSENHLGKPAKGGLENMSMTTGFVPADLETTIPFGYGIVSKTGKEGEVLLPGESGASKQFLGITAFSQEATSYTKTHTGPVAKNAVYPNAYAAGDVVGIVTRGSVICKVAAGSSGIQAGDRICVIKGGFIDAYKNYTAADGGSNEAFLIDAVAESDGKANECISIQLFGAAATLFKYN